MNFRKIYNSVKDTLTIIGNCTNVVIGNSRIQINGKDITSEFSNYSSDTRVIIEGDVSGGLQADGSVSCSNVTGNVKAAGSCNCDGVLGSVSAGGSVRCDDVGGNVTAGGSVKCDDITGKIK